CAPYDYDVLDYW
nr:immunoglobulin heavy chain junction region [Mus musculus]